MSVEIATTDSALVFPRDGLLDAVDTLLEGPPQLIVVRDLISEDFATRLFNYIPRPPTADGTILTRQIPRKLATEGLYDDVPELPEVDAKTAVWWRKHGYSDYALNHENLFLQRVMALEDSSVPHLDGDKNAIPDNDKKPVLMFGPFVLSVCVRNSGEYYGQSLGRDFRLPGTQAFDNAGYVEAQHEIIRTMGKKKPRKVLGDPIIQTTRDGVFTPIHPKPVVHAVKPTKVLFLPTRRAYLFEHQLRKVAWL